MKISKCDICGKELDEFDIQESFVFHYDNIGYGSKFDGESVTVDMCCNCFDKMMDEYILPKLSKEENKIALGGVKPSSVVKLGNREYIVLGHENKTTAIIAKDFVKEMSFSITGDYATSNVRKYCNGEFLDELAAAVGIDNIVEHTVNLIADDGTGRGKSCKDKVSVLTTENYHRYREFLKAYGKWWWTATRVTYDEDYACYVCCVNSDGVLVWDGCGCCSGVRPFCILNSSVLIPSISVEAAV